MRVLQVVTLLSPNQSFGGPVQVAVNLAHELLSRGNDVAIAGGARGFAAPITSYEGIQTITAPVHQVLPGAGFNGLASPWLLARLARRLRTYDVVHIHLSRDLVTMPVALLALALGCPLVIQTHGMIDPSTRVLAGPMDLLATRLVLRRADVVLHLTNLERSHLQAVARDASLDTDRLLNGVPASGHSEWTDDGTVLFASRLHPRKRATVFVRAAAEVARTRPQARFVIAGADEGELGEVRWLIRELGMSSAVSYVGPLPHADLLDRLRSAALYVLPSVDEPYPMTVLEAMSVGTPVLVSTSCGLAADVQRTGAGAVVEPSVTAVAEAMGAMLDDVERRHAAGRAAASAAAEIFGIGAVTDTLIAVYGRAIAEGRRVTR